MQERQLTPETSIIIPYFNSSNTLEYLINGIKSQRYLTFECILVDDGSSDDSFRLTDTLIQADPRFINVKRPAAYRPGGRGAKNYGFSLCKGAFIIFFDSDDVMLPDYLSLRIEYLKIHTQKHAVISHYYWKVKANEPRKRTFTYRSEVFENFTAWVRSDEFWINYMDYRFFYPPGNPMYRRSFIENKPMWDETTAIGEDHEYHARLFLQGLDLGLIDEATFDYMANPNSMIATSEAIKPLLSRSYGKMLVIDNVMKAFGHRQILVEKELFCQTKFLRRIVICKASPSKKKEAVDQMLDRIKHLFIMLGHSQNKINRTIRLLKLVIFFQRNTGRGHQLYTLIISDPHPTDDGKLFSIQ
jgi:glycosyltransferase involved in cell wall biosynthesis